MKKWLIILGFPIVGVVVVVGLAVANLSSFVNENREWISDQARASVGRGIDFGEVGIRVWDGLAVRVDRFEIEDDPAFSKDAFVSAEAIEVEVAFLPALRGNIQVDRVVLRSPTITVIQTAKGLNLDSLGVVEGEQAAAPSDPDGEPLPAFLIAFVDISDGTLRYVDRTVEPASETRIDQLDFRAIDIRSKGPIDFELKAAVLEATEQNIRVTGRVADLEDPILDLVLTSKVLDPNPAEGAAPTTLFKDLELKANVALAGAAPKIRASLRSSEGVLAEIPYEDLAIEFDLQNRVATIESSSLKSLGGLLEVAGRYDMRVPDEPKFDVKAGISGLSLEEVMRQQLPGVPPTIMGALNFDLTLAGAGDDWDSIKRSLKGKGALEVLDGLLKDVNFVETALGGASGVPGMSNLLPPQLRSDYPELFGVGDTVIDALRTHVQIDDGWASFREMRFGAKDYEVSGRGRVSLDGKIEVGTTLRLSNSLSDALVAQASALGYLRSGDGRVQLPVRLSGVAPHIQVSPDVDAIAKVASKQAASKLLGDVLINAIGESKGKRSDEGRGEGTKSGGVTESEGLLRRAIGDLLGN